MQQQGFLGTNKACSPCFRRFPLIVCVNHIVVSESEFRFGFNWVTLSSSLSSHAVFLLNSA